MPAIEKKHYVSIWLAGMPSMCLANIMNVGNLFSSLRHQDKGHL
jgi:hypothetical protein